MDAAEARRADALLAELASGEPRACVDCGTPLCGHARVVNVALGFRNEARCVRCLAAALDRDETGLLEQVKEYVMSRACYRAGWEWASAHGGTL